jgi:flagellar motor switch protein FliG
MVIQGVIMEQIEKLIDILKDEHPQTCAVVLALLKPKEAARVLQAASRDFQSDIASRIAFMDVTTDIQLRRITETLKTNIPDFEKLLHASPQAQGLGGLKCLSGIIRKVDLSTEKYLIYAIEDEDPELAEEIKRRMFLLDDIVQLNDPAIQKVLREIDKETLAKALLSVNMEARERILRNMSKNAAGMLTEDMRACRQTPPEEIEEAQAIIVSVIRHLYDVGEIIIASDDDRIESIETDEEVLVKKTEELIRQNYCPVCFAKITPDDVQRMKDPSRRCAKCEQELRDKLPPRYDDGPAILKP